MGPMSSKMQKLLKARPSDRAAVPPDNKINLQVVKDSVEFITTYPKLRVWPCVRSPHQMVLVGQWRDLHEATVELNCGVTGERLVEVLLPTTIMKLFAESATATDDVLDLCKKSRRSVNMRRSLTAVTGFEDASTGMNTYIN